MSSNSLIIYNQQNQDLSCKQVVKYSHLINTPLRIAQFSTLCLSNVIPPTALNSSVLSVLASFSFVFVQHPSNSDSNQTEADVVLSCPLCFASFSLAHILRRIPFSAIPSTSELLRELGVLHLANCNGHSAIERLNEDDTYFSVPESLLKASPNLNSLRETGLSPLYYTRTRTILYM